MNNNIVHIVGGGGPKKKHFVKRQEITQRYPGRGNVKVPDKKAKPRMPNPKPMMPGVIVTKKLEGLIKIWEDRNRSNNGTKLNP